MKISRQLMPAETVFMPSLSALVANRAIMLKDLELQDETDTLKGTLEINHRDKIFSSEFTVLDLSMLAVKYTNAVVADIFESGVASKTRITLTTLKGSAKINCKFSLGDGLYLPKAASSKDSEGRMFLEVLPPYYSKSVIKIDDWVASLESD